MLSVCIPVYHYDARPLANELRRQAIALDTPIEILVYDDASGTSWQCENRKLLDLPSVRYREMPENIGRAAIRNLMAREATGEHLIMLDVDSWPNPTLLENYAAHVSSEVVVGGTTYAIERPADPELFLHWHYGRRREALAPARRRNRFFQSNNFLVRREVMLANPFPDVDGYGHEDTLWGQLLVPAKITIQYIENPVVHLGLESNRVFLAKQKKAVENLRLLRKQHPTLRTRLTTFADRYPKFSTLSGYVPEEVLEKYVLETGNLKALDLLKLKWWISGWLPAIGYL
ncbi:glycosyl transferase family 2 [Neolewinella xylanilytica]|uniref:Glycosyl transferase family 2 n=1 Tax=Neolewinella xylanilytica TaxID=1514080 RepID=A0A2S6I2J9_9BACT|nr:glycosyltransferase [Neolewinella xylanilytica]PPK85395.1 glycosyl transferase family 2 [Neolewinella xylanilytica]